jgi:hypothetical protein
MDSRFALGDQKEHGTHKPGFGAAIGSDTLVVDVMMLDSVRGNAILLRGIGN